MFTTDLVNLYNRNIFKTSLYIYIFQDEKCRLMRNLSLSMDFVVENCSHCPLKRFSIICMHLLISSIRSFSSSSCAFLCLNFLIWSHTRKQCYFLSAGSVRYKKNLKLASGKGCFYDFYLSADSVSAWIYVFKFFNFREGFPVFEKYNFLLLG